MGANDLSKDLFFITERLLINYLMDSLCRKIPVCKVNAPCSKLKAAKSYF